MLTLEKVNEVSIIQNEDRILKVLNEIADGRNDEYRIVLGWNVRLTITSVCVARDPHCANCGKEVDKIVVTRCGTDSFRFKFFTEDNVVLTKDHVIPASQGGSTHSHNLQTLCYTCNHEKGDEFNGRIVKAFGAKHVRTIFNFVGRPDLIDLMIDKIKKRKEEGKKHPTFFTFDSFLEEFPIFTKNRLESLMKEIEKEQGYEPCYEVAESQISEYK